MGLFPLTVVLVCTLACSLPRTFAPGSPRAPAAEHGLETPVNWCSCHVPRGEQACVPVPGLALGEVCFRAAQKQLRNTVGHILLKTHFQLHPCVMEKPRWSLKAYCILAFLQEAQLLIKGVFIGRTKETYRNGVVLLWPWNYTTVLHYNLLLESGC